MKKIRLINNGKKSVQVGGGNSIAPGHEYECDTALGEQILAACTFVSEVDSNDKTGDDDGNTGSKKEDEISASTEKQSAPREHAPTKKTSEKKKISEEQKSLL